MKDGDIRVPAAEHAYQVLRDRILSSKLAGGDRLIEDGLAKELGISRTPIRAAITRLIHEGLVERGEGYSTCVAQYEREELLRIFEIRRRIESYAARLAATNVTPEQIARLDAITTRMEAITPPATPRDYDEISAINAEFHGIIQEAAATPRLTAVLNMVVDVGVVAHTLHHFSEADLRRSAQHHRELVDALRSGVPDWAESVMSSHVSAASHAAERFTK